VYKHKVEINNLAMASQESTDSTAPTKTTPKDALVMASILKEMGITEYEPRVVNQMIEFAYRYVTDVVEDARVYSTHSNRKTLNIDDIKLAVSQKLDHSFTSPPPREFLLDIARTKNSQPLSLVQEKSGLRLPPERYCLLANNYRTKAQKKTANQQKKQAASKATAKGAAANPLLPPKPSANQMMQGKPASNQMMQGKPAANQMMQGKPAASQFMQNSHMTNAPPMG